jgi:hypothetical protein
VRVKSVIKKINEYRSQKQNARLNSLAFLFSQSLKSPTPVENTGKKLFV